MARRGKESYDAHFAGSGEIETVVKSGSGVLGEAIIYDPKTNAVAGTLKKGKGVVFIDEGVYKSKALIRYGKKEFRISFSKLTKPGVRASSTASLKPQAFGIREVEYNFDGLRDVVLDTLSDRQDIKATLKGYLELLLLYHSEGSKITNQELRDAFEPIRTDTFLKRNIIKDFGELLGPFAIYANTLLEKLSNRKLNVPVTMKSWFPSSGSHHMIDYVIVFGVGNKQRRIPISAKAKGPKSNVIKPYVIFDLLSGKYTSKNLIPKWQNTTQYKILKALDDHSTNEGPFRAVNLLKNKPKGFSKKGMDNIISKKENYDESLWSDFISTNKIVQRNKPTKGKPSFGIMRYACEKWLEDACHHKGEADMKEIFIDAITSSIVIVKFHLDSFGIPQWSVEDDESYAKMEHLCLRTKNTINRSGDKMGIQP